MYTVHILGEIFIVNYSCNFHNSFILFVNIDMTENVRKPSAFLVFL